jgi:hypothetical protein
MRVLRPGGGDVVTDQMAETERQARIAALERQIQELRDLVPMPPAPSWARWLMDNYPELGVSWGVKGHGWEIYPAAIVPGIDMGGALYALELRHPRALPAHRAIVALLEAIGRGEVERP